MATAKWNFEAEYIQSCNCDYGCPCNFNALPTEGNCEALVGWHIRTGQFNGTKLDGAKFAAALYWPAAIHQGGGTARAYFDPSVKPEQLTALGEILSGKVGGGVFEIFPKTWSKVLPPKTAKIDWHYAGYDSWFKVEGVGEVHSEHIKNPVSGETFEGTVALPGGIAFKEAIVSNIRRWWMRDDELLSFNENKNGHVCVVKYSEKGCIG
ncbi:MAG TPA: DUF1326 domain-containing protein [Thermoplasmata archaeon]|nr:DUF1326 domain-containing protein [Thermoplasmata archaeon]